MSDYDFDQGYTPAWMYGVKIGLFLIFGLLFYFYFLSPILNNYENDQKLHQNDYQSLGKQTEKTLSDSNVTCEQIQNMRQLHVQVTDSWKDPLYWKSNFDTARDLWNAKNCGNHWGWFES